MAVKFQPFAVTGATGSNGAFTDTFTRANVSEGAGPNWAVNRQPPGDTNLFDINTNALRWFHSAGGTGNGDCFLWPLPGGALFGAGAAGASSLQAPNHFSQCTWIADNSAASITRVGPSVAMTGVTIGGTCYAINNAPELLSFALVRDLNGTLTNLVDHTAAPVYATVVGLTIKISVEFTSAAVTTVRTYVNGALLDTFLDTNAARLINGMPGMFGNFCSAGVQATWSSYSCGPGI